MMNEETKQHWIRIGTVALLTFLVSYLAFFIVLKSHFKNYNNPFYQVERMEKFLEKEEMNFDIYDKMTNPFEPKMRPMIANLVREANEYKVIVDLNQLDGDESAINITVQGDELTVRGQLDKKIRGTEKIINFTQTYYLDEKIDERAMVKERKGNKYIVTIPFLNPERENNDNDD